MVLDGVRWGNIVFHHQIVGWFISWKITQKWMIWGSHLWKAQVRRSGEGLGAELSAGAFLVELYLENETEAGIVVGCLGESGRQKCSSGWCFQGPRLIKINQDYILQSTIRKNAKMNQEKCQEDYRVQYHIPGIFPDAIVPDSRCVKNNPPRRKLSHSDGNLLEMN